VFPENNPFFKLIILNKIANDIAEEMLILTIYIFKYRSTQSLVST